MNSNLTRSAAFPNAKVVPPQRGDNDFMMRSRKLNCAADMLEDSLRAKVKYIKQDFFLIHIRTYS